MANVIRCNVERSPMGGFEDNPMQLVDCRLEGWTRALPEAGAVRRWKPPVDISETGSHYMITMEAPGMDLDSLEVTYSNGLLDIKGEKRKETELNECCHCSERFAGCFERRFRISGAVDDRNIDAAYKDGILKISIPKAEGSEPRKIEVH